MKEGFLDIIKIQSEGGNTFSNLEDYYKSPSLARDIEALLFNRINENQVLGKNVLIKPNWVKHSSRETDEFCLRTHDNIVLSALTSLLIMKPAAIIIGDAPIQGCHWDKMMSANFMQSINDLAKQFNIPIQIKDFRRRIYDVSQNNPLSELRPLSDYLIFDLGKKSNLEPITEGSKFRVNNYDPDRMTRVHAPGIHKYCIIKDFFNADLVIQIPKIKTHQKTGITGALKNLVGINGDKDFLPHHRMGGTLNGGDCYPGKSFLRYAAEVTLDQANRRQGYVTFWLWQKLSSALWHLSRPGFVHNVDAGWYGNDTSWRMVADLNLIAAYGKADGTLSNTPQRQIYSLSDAVIAGQGDGPLEPLPMPLGILSFANDSLCNDMAMAILMGLPVEKLPLLKGHIHDTENRCNIMLNGEKAGFDDLFKYSVKALPPKGWISYLNQ